MSNAAIQKLQKWSYIIEGTGQSKKSCRVFLVSTFKYNFAQSTVQFDCFHLKVVMWQKKSVKILTFEFAPFEKNTNGVVLLPLLFTAPKPFFKAVEGLGTI